MLTCAQLYSRGDNPRINDISLELLRQYYEQYLLEKNFIYILKEQGRKIDVQFKKENFCHLLGVESVFRSSVSKKKLSEYQGLLGWNGIRNEQITFALMKEINKRGFADNKTRYVFFYLIPHVLENPHCVLFDKSKMKSRSNIECELLLYDKLSSAYVHLGIEKHDDGYYIPRTFLVEKITAFSDGEKYITNQNQTEIIMSKQQVAVTNE